MAVYCNSISVIIRRDSIDKYHKGGWNQFIFDLQDNLMCCDGEIVNVGFTLPGFATSYVDSLRKKGLQYYQTLDDSASTNHLNYLKRKGQKYDHPSNDSMQPREVDDIVVLDSIAHSYLNDHNELLDWIEVGDKKFNNEEYSCCWLKSSTLETLAFPLGFHIGFRERRFQKMPHWVDFWEFERFIFVRTENELDIYSDPYFKKTEYFMPHGMPFEDYHAHFKFYRDALYKKNAEKKKIEEKAEKARFVEEQKANENRLAIEKIAEDNLTAKVAKKLKNKTCNDDDAIKALEALVEHALKTNTDKDLELIEEFWYGDYGSFDFHDYVDFYVSVEPHEIIVKMKFQWDYELGYEESEWSEMSDEEKFDIFKDRITDQFEFNGSHVIKKIGNYFISAHLTDVRENRPYFGFNVHNNLKEFENWYKSDGDFYYSESGKGNCNDQSMKAFFDEHYLKRNHLDDLLGALINNEGVEAATEKFNLTIKKYIAGDKKPMMYSISNEDVIDRFEECLSEHTSENGFEYHKAVLQMDVGDFMNGYVVQRHHNYVMTADWNLMTECSSFRLFYSDWEMNKYYKDNGEVLFSLDKQYPPLNYTDKQIRELYDKSAKKLL
jgi:hypothetical protein